MKNKLSILENGAAQSFIFILLFSFQTVFAQIEWRPVSQAELDLKTPVVEADADAEAIFWEARLDDKKSYKMYYNHYVRVKIFTERGRERFSKFDIPFTKGKKVEDVAARVIKPDGTIIELQPGEIFEREILKAGKLLIKAKSFAVPGIEPGVIVEYQYKETFKGDSVGGERLAFQRDIPIQKITYYVRPYKNSTLNFDFQNMPQTRFLMDKEGFYVGVRENVPSFKEEPQMPPEDEVHQWVLISYNSIFGFSWSFFGKSMALTFDDLTKPNKEVVQKAHELTANAQNEDEKLKNIYDFVQRQIKNYSYDRSLTDEQRESSKKWKLSDPLRNGAGSSMEINFLFASLAKAAGFDVNIMYSGNREQNFFNYQKDLNRRFVHFSGIAVRRANEWKPFDPGTPFMPYGMTFWHDESISTMIAGGGGHSWIRLPLVDHSKNLSKRTGKFKLHDDGTLEGFIRVEHFGHQATSRRGELFVKSVGEREDLLKKSWKETVSAAEIFDFAFENFEDSAKPYTYSFKVRVPNYAQKTGKRLFFQPNFFEYGTSPLFSSATRKHAIYFDFPWSENDEIEIELPQNFEADSAEPPGDVKETGGIGRLSINMAIDKQKNTLKYDRNFYFGNNGKILFAAAAYQPLKILFDAFHKADTHMISLKQKQ